MKTRRKKATSLIWVEYSSNNSGGSWWLKDKDWAALDAAGWRVEWTGTRPIYKKVAGKEVMQIDDEGLPIMGPQSSGALRPDSKSPDGKPRWLGALATSAYKRFDSLAEAISDFESVTGQVASDEGCNCCGPPHSFSTQDSGEHQYASGDECAAVLYGGGKPTYREALAELARLKGKP